MKQHTFKVWCELAGNQRRAEQISETTVRIHHLKRRHRGMNNLLASSCEYSRRAPERGKGLEINDAVGVRRPPFRKLLARSEEFSTRHCKGPAHERHDVTENPWKKKPGDMREWTI